MRIRTTAVVGALSAATLLAAAPALATPAPTARPASVTTAASRVVNIPGLPLRANFPSSWPTYSPKSLYNSHTRVYPAGVRYVAGLEHQTPATYVQAHREVNLEGYGTASHTSVPTFEVVDLGARNITRAQLGALLRREGGRVTGTSAVHTRFGTVYRLSYHSVGRGHIFNGVAGISHVNGHSILVDVSSYYSSQSRAVSDTALRSLTRR